MGAGIEVAGITWHRLGNCETFVRTKVAFEEDSILYCMDFVTLVHMISSDEATTRVKKLLAQDHHATKDGFKSIHIVFIYSSM